MSKIKVKISGTKYRSFYKTLVDGAYVLDNVFFCIDNLIKKHSMTVDQGPIYWGAVNN